MTFDEMLVQRYGNVIKADLEEINDKIAAIIAAHCFAGKSGNNPLCALNRALDTVLERN